MRAWSRRPSKRRHLTILLGLLLWPGALLAQTPTATVTGFVRDTVGSPIGGAAVIARDVAAGYEYIAESDERGRYWLTRMPPGVYDLTAQRIDVGSVVRRAVRLAVGQEAVIDFAIEPRAVELPPLEVVDERPLIETTLAKIAYRLDREQIEELPDESRDFLELAQLAPGATRAHNTVEGVSPTNVGALSSYHTGVVVDGVNFAGPSINEVFGTIPLAAIEEFEVLTTGYSAEYGQAASGVVNAITRRGTNELETDVFLRYRHHALNTRGVFEEEKPDFNRNHWGIAAGGPISRDRTHFFAAFERRDESSFATVRTDGVFPELEGTFEAPLEDNLFFARVDHRINDVHEVTLRYAGQSSSSRTDIGASDACPTGPGSEAFGANNEDRLHSVVGIHRWSLNDGRAVNETRIAFQRRRGERIPVSNEPTLQYPSVCDGGNWVSGTTRSTRVDLRNDYSLGLPGPAGSHRLKVGVLAALVDVLDRSGNFTNGYFAFLDDPPSDPDQYLVSLGGFGADERGMQFAAYVQDQWAPIPSLTLDLGLRYDVETNGTNQDFVAPEAGDFPFAPLSERPVDGDNFAPRLGFVWDPGEDDRMIVRGGYGVFFNQSAMFYAGLESSRNPVAFVSEPGTTNPDDISIDPLALPGFLGENFESPSTRQFSLGLERLMGEDVVVSLDGILVSGHNLPIFRNLNVVTAYDSIFGEDGTVDSVPASWRYHQSGGVVAQLLSAGEADARMLTVRARRQSERAWFDVSYTLGERETTSDEWFVFTPQVDPDSEDFSGEMGPAAWDERHRLVAIGGARASFGTGFAVKAVYASGRPYNVVTTEDLNGDGPFNFNDRPPGVSRNSERGPDYFGIDLGASHRFDVGNAALQVGLNVYNLTNRDNFDPESVIGVVESPSFGMAFAALPRRQVELSMGVRF